MNGGELVARVLIEQQVKSLFTLCGGHISPILVEAKKNGIRVIDTRHEANAVFAADATARLTGRPGVVAVTAGPGITNTLTAVHNSLVAQAPVVLLGGAAPTLLKGRGALQDIDQMKLIRPNVKWADAVRRRREIYPKLTKAFQQAMDGVPGPVFLELPVDLLYDESLVRSWYVKGTTSGETLQQKLINWYINRHVNNMFAGEGLVRAEKISIEVPAHTPGQVNKVVKELQKAERPLLVIGSGAMMQAHKANQLATALKHLAMPVYVSGMARGLLGADHELLFRHHRKEALREADLVMLAGVPCDFRLDYGRQINRKATLIGINRSTIDLNRNRKPDIGICADPLDFLMALSQKTPIQKKIDWVAILQTRDNNRESDILKDGSTQTGTGINPVQLFIELSKRIMPDHCLVADGGDFVGTASYILKPSRPLSWLDPGAFGTLGIGGGFALGAKLFSPETTVYILYGDGSSAYSLMEMDTFVRHKLPVIVIIGNDASWSQIARDQVEILQDGVGTELSHSNYEKVAEAFGGQGEKVTTIPEFIQAIERAHESVQQGKPFVINAILASSGFRKGSLSM